MEPMAVVMNPARRNGRSTNSSLTSPTSPAARKAQPSDGSTDSPNRTFAMNPANAPIVACEARAKFGKRRTA